jgi:hypothetical protein
MPFSEGNPDDTLETIGRRHSARLERPRAANRQDRIHRITAIPSLNKTLVLELARCEYIAHRDNAIAVGNSGTGKTHIALGLGLAGCQKGLSVGFITAAAIVHELIEARDDAPDWCRHQNSTLVPPGPSTHAPRASATRNRGLWLIECVFGVRRNGTGREALKSRDRPVPLRARALPGCRKGQWRLPRQVELSLKAIDQAARLSHGSL